jgi:hypothetical protein
MSVFRSVLLMLSAVPLLIGCVSHDTGGLEQGASIKFELLAGLGSGPKADVVQTKASDRLLASLFKRNVVSEVDLIDRRGTITEWASADGATITLDDGILISTSGLSDDLYSAEVEPLQAAMSQGGGSYTRTFRYLDGERVIRSVEAACILRQSEEGSEFTELCREVDGTFINRFRVLPNTLLILASRQWVSREVGYLGLNPPEGP